MGKEEMDSVTQDILSSRFDELTELPTYAEFKEEAAAFLEAHPENCPCMAVVATSLVNFRSFNRLYGFAQGDVLLHNVARSFKSAFEGYPIMRYSEDRFYALCDASDIQMRIKQINDEVIAQGENAGVRFKAGIYYLDPSSDSVNSALDKAQAACESIRNNFEAFCCVYDESLLLTQHIIYHLDEAIEQGWIEIWAQPIVRVGTERPCGLEALARWNDPEFGLISPAIFVPVLEQRGLIGKVDQYVVRSLGNIYQQTIRNGFTPLPMSINFSRADFEMFNVVEELNAVCSEYGIPHSMIHIEVTESSLASNVDLMHRQLSAIHDAGYKVWIDDFGSGYSTFSALQDFEFDLIKLDMDFLRRYSIDPKAGIIITALIDMAKQLGIQTLAEGVETQEQYELLKKIGCEKAQGFFFWKPMSQSQLVEERQKVQFAPELRSEAGYYNEIGRVNIVGHALAPVDDERAPLTINSAMAILELRDGAFNFLASNTAYDQYIKELGFESLQAAADNLTNPVYTSGTIMRDAAFKAMETGEPVITNHVDNAIRCVSTLRFVGNDPTSGANAFLLTSINLTRFSRFDTGDLYDSALSYLLEMHDRVDIFSSDGSFVRNIYHKCSDNGQNVVSDSLEKTLRAYCKTNIYEDDQQAYMDFFDLDTIDGRLAASPGNIVGVYLLTHDSALGWVRKLYTITPMNVDGKRLYLSCLHKVSPDWLSNQACSREVITKDDLWASLDSAQGISMFWKDAHKRYLGANGAFLEHYHLDSPRSFLGKTGEEMGWLVNPALSNASDEYVLEKGQSIQNELEYTIVSGEVRRVMISRMPIKGPDDKINGILGIFIDLNNDKLKSLLGIEKIHDVLSLYQRAFEEHERDFTICALRLRYTDDQRQLFGEEFEGAMLDAMAQSLSRKLSNEGVCCMGPDNLFVILHHTDAKHGELCGVCDAIRSVKEVNGIPCEIPFDRAFVNYSACGSFEGACKVLEESLATPSCAEALRDILLISS